jgi:hypothetical protein
MESAAMWRGAVVYLFHGFDYLLVLFRLFRSFAEIQVLQARHKQSPAGPF